MKNQLHFRKIPQHIEDKLNEISSQYIIVATSLAIQETQIKNGEFAHLGIKFINNQLNIQDIITPNALKGRYAKRNIEGYDIIHKNLPKINKHYSWEVPNFGDPYKGYHEISFKRLVYQKTHIAPREWNIRVQLLKTELNANNNSLFTFKIYIDTILYKSDATFKDDLFFAINLLQENTYSCDIFNANITDDEFLITRTVGWEIFPAGSINPIITYVYSQTPNIPAEIKEHIRDRISFLKSLNPTEYIAGKGMNKRYIGAKLQDNLIVFENVEYGNAIYILFDNWEEISQMSRIEILQRKENDFIRICHRKNWESILTHTINKLRQS